MQEDPMPSADEALQTLLAEAAPVPSVPLPLVEACGCMLAATARVGEAELAAGAWLRPQDVGVLAAAGDEDVRVIPRPRTGVVAVGQGGATALQIEAFVKAVGCPVARVAAAGASPGELQDAVTALGAADVLLVTGGPGSARTPAAVLEELGIRTLFDGVAMRPGGDSYGGLLGDVPVLAVSADPLGVLLASLLFVEPVLQKRSGQADCRPRLGYGLAGETLAGAPDVRVYLPVRMESREEGISVRPVEGEGAEALCRTNGFAVLEPGAEAAPLDPVSVLLAD
jgi:molybdopterin biosynthesis enzyme